MAILVLGGAGYIGPHTVYELIGAGRDIVVAVNLYTATVRQMCYEACAATPDPMMAAVKTLSFMTIGIKDATVGEEKVPVRSIVDREKAIDPADLHAHIEGGIGYDKNWVSVVQKVNFLLTARKAVELGLDPTEVNDSYSMNSIARQMDMGKTPTSKTQLLKAVQAAVTAMIGEGYTVLARDVNYLLSIYSKKGRHALTVSCARHGYMRGCLMEICHRIVTDGVYGLDYQQRKQPTRKQANYVDPNAESGKSAGKPAEKAA